MNKPNIVFLVFIIALAVIALGQARPPENNLVQDNVLERRVAGDELRQLTTADALRESLVATGVAGGIVVVPSCQDEPLTQKWKPMNSTLRDALAWIVAQDPQYRWVVKRGVVNLLPGSAEPALLRVRIDHFRAENVRSVHEAYNRLTSLPEVRKAIATLKLSDSYERLQGGSQIHKDEAGFIHQAWRCLFC